MDSHLVDFLNIVGENVIQELLEAGAGVHTLQLLFVKIQHLIHPPLELQLKISNKIHSVL